MRSFSKVVFPLVFASLAFVPCRQTLAEILPTKGTFRGIYHENRAGVGHFLFFIVHKDLRRQMQPLNRGPSIIEKFEGTLISNEVAFEITK